MFGSKFFFDSGVVLGVDSDFLIDNLVDNFWFLDFEGLG